MSIFTKFDFFGVPATLNFFGDTKMRSNFGGLCSILFIGFVAWIIYNSSIDLVKRTNPKFSFSEIVSDDPKELEISLDVFPIAFLIQTSSGLNVTNFVNESIYTLEVYHQMIKTIQQPGGFFRKVITNTPLKLEICRPDYFGVYTPSFASFPFLGSYCISKNQPGLEKLKLQGIYTSDTYQTITASVVTCNSTTSGGSSISCGSDEEISNALSKSYFSVVYLDSAVNIQNYSNPATQYKEMYTTTMNPNSLKEIFINVGQVQIQTDLGLFTENTHTDNVRKVKKTFEMVNQNPDSNNTLLYCAIQGSRIETLYTRSFKKIPTVLAEILGFTFVVFGIFSIIVVPYFRLKSREALMNELFDAQGKPSGQRRLNTLKSSFYERQISSSNPKKVRIDERQDNARSKWRSRDFRLTKTLTSNTILSKNSYLTYPNEIQDNPQSNPATGLTPVSEENVATPRSQSDNLFYKPEYKEQRGEDAEYEQIAISSQRENSLASPQNTSPRRLISENCQLTRTEGDKFEDKEFDQMDYKEEEVEEDIDIEKQLQNIETIKRRETTIREEVESRKKVSIDIPVTYDRFASYRTDQDKDDVSIQIKPRGALKSGYLSTRTDSLSNQKASLSKVELNIWEYLLSFFCKPGALRTKIDIIEHGIKSVEEKLDLNSILKKLWEVEKLLIVLLDRDQRELFDNLPKPTLQSQKRGSYIETKLTIEENTSKKISTLETLKNEEYLQLSYERLRHKTNKSDIDRRLADIFKNGYM